MPGFINPVLIWVLHEEFYSRELLNEATSSFLVTPWVEANYSIRYFDMRFKEALHTSGVTAVGVFSGSFNIVSEGQAVLLRLGAKKSFNKKSMSV